MAVIGNKAAANDISVFKTISKQTITGTGATSYALDLSIGGPNDLEVFVNNVRQEPSVAYNVGSGLITFTEAIDSTDDCYLIYQGGRVGTVTHPSDQPLEATTGTFSGAISGTDGTFTGKVGIGTSSHYDTSTKLTVAGRINTSNGTAIGSMNYGGGSVVNMGSLSNHPLQLITNNTTRMVIDSEGRVTMPYQPAFMAIGDGRAAYGAGTDLVYGATRFNVGGHYSTSTGRFTAPIAGRYAFYANSMGSSTDDRFMLRIALNGVDYHQGSSSSNANQYQDSKLFVLAELNAGDYLYVRNVGNKSTYTFNDLEHWFCGYLIS